MMCIRKADGVSNFNRIIQTLIFCLYTVQFIIVKTVDRGGGRGEGTSAKYNTDINGHVRG
jgi:hypothetical protein